MTLMDNPALQTYCLWAGINMLLMLALALNVTRMRFKVGAGNATEDELQRAVRAHGNNIEYVPIILLALGIMLLAGHGSAWLHSLGGVLFVARLCHAHGIQQAGPGLPKTRVAGNLGTWSVMLITSLALIVAFV